LALRTARELRPSVELVVRSRRVNEIEELRELGADAVVADDFETTIEPDAERKQPGAERRQCDHRGCGLRALGTCPVIRAADGRPRARPSRPDPGLADRQAARGARLRGPRGCLARRWAL